MLPLVKLRSLTKHWEFSLNGFGYKDIEAADPLGRLFLFPPPLVVSFVINARAVLTYCSSIPFYF